MAGATAKFTVEVEYHVEGRWHDATRGLTVSELELEQSEQVVGLLTDELGFLRSEPGCWLRVDVTESTITLES